MATNINLASHANILKDRDKIGMGSWFAIHITAKNATTNEKITHFCIWIRDFILDFRCQECREDALRYIEKNPPERYRHIKSEYGEIIGMFYWTVDFHNYVNNKTIKEIIPRNKAYILYYDPTYANCEDCGKNKDNESSESKSSNKYISKSRYAPRI
jgi:hypothetical protein